jgi:hypothetical protein
MPREVPAFLFWQRSVAYLTTVCHRSDGGLPCGRPRAFHAPDANALTPLGVGRPYEISMFPYRYGSGWLHTRCVAKGGSSDSPKSYRGDQPPLLGIPQFA